MPCRTAAGSRAPRSGRNTARSPCPDRRSGAASRSSRLRRSSLVLPHDHGRTGARRGPAEVGADTRILHLPAAAFAVVVRVLSLAVRPHRAEIVHVVAQLPHVLNDHADAVRVPLAQVAAAGVVRAPAAQLDRAVAHVLPALALLA